MVCLYTKEQSQQHWNEETQTVTTRLKMYLSKRQVYWGCGMGEEKRRKQGRQVEGSCSGGWTSAGPG